MSDALSEIARDQQRASAFVDYLMKLSEWAEAGFPPEGREAVKAAASDTDMIRGGYWGSSTNLMARIDQRLDDLAAGDPKQWGRLLHAADDEWNPTIRDRLRAASPFKDGVIAFADYGHGFVRYSSSFDELLAKAITAKGGTAFDCEKHMLVIPEDVFDRIEIVTLQERRR